ncbi:alpha/beta hydrolase [Dactylosporangium roseum]|uniref:Alpha/beta hydrolase n=1 Tax=Dactylosporangium roseum TaxID=47989 RepID=A0ABY5YVT7_9ACTN|nr:alpha/beta hydrolase [Dactylosporangium roseum]UWZ33632.1 alpha/beta hydrolase [Dactylosporangium roseum]
MAEQFIQADGVTLCAEAFGERTAPATLLISGASASMDWWDAGFCLRLAAQGRRVIRYDHRDTGRSTAYPPGAPGYQGADLCADALTVAAALTGASRAPVQLVGVSMGGGIAQRIAAEHPDRVASLALIATSPIVTGPDVAPLPPPAPRIQVQSADPGPTPDWTDRAAFVERIVAGEALFAGSLPSDVAALRTLAGAVFDRTTDVAAGQTNHWILGDDHPFTGSLSAITAPTVVLHGTEDPLFPLPHGEALAAAIPGARLVPLRGMGHQVPPPPLWDTVIAELAALPA